MTLNTSIYLHGAVDIPEFFEFCQRALLAFDEQARSLDQVIWSDKEGWRGEGSRYRGSQLGQGLPAILDISYRPDGALRTVEAAAKHDEYCNEEGDCDGSGHTPAHWAEVSLDTAYGWQDPHRGWRCGDLHAALIRLFGARLDELGVPFSWENEYTGEVHDGCNNLDELGKASKGAAEWFNNVAMPAIQAHARENGGTVQQ